jgi:NAD(P)H-hydrate epimerase
MTGAVALVAKAAYRAGAGLVQVAVPSGILPIVQSTIEEATFVPLSQTEGGAIARDAVEQIADNLEGADAVAVGPGLTAAEDPAAFVRRLVWESPAPLVVDADGLNAFSGHAPDLADRKADAILTPHAGEFARLVGETSREVGADRVGRCRALAGETRAVVLLKGTRTVIAEPGGVARVNPTGGPVLATAGSGDVLTGIVSGLAARGLAPFDAACAGAYLHGLAGRLAGLQHGEGATAGDVLDRVGEAFLEVSGR